MQSEDFKTVKGRMLSTEVAQMFGYDDQKALRLIAEGADVNVCSAARETPLMRAAASARTAMIRPLLTAGAEINAQDRDGRTALLHALNGRASIVAQILIREGADVNVAAASDGMTAFIFAASNGDMNTLKMLLEAQVDINAQDHQGQTALHWAAMIGRADIIGKILEAGADATIKDHSGNMAVDLAQENEFFSGKNILQNKMRDIFAEKAAAGTSAKRRVIRKKTKAGLDAGR
ncbi:MAG: ankyrin repeat domain-containing protein [Alphaproteobacteria bacterium]|nr:ankyrin repeat domain-containing protein [Alphaproteobacteria bacterium]